MPPWLGLGLGLGHVAQLGDAALHHGARRAHGVGTRWARVGGEGRRGEARGGAAAGRLQPAAGAAAYALTLRLGGLRTVEGVHLPEQVGAHLRRGGRRGQGQSRWSG